MGIDSKQVFQSDSEKRWKIFKNSIRLTLIIIVMAAGVIFIDIISKDSILLPKMREENEVYKRILNPDKIATFATSQNTKLKQAIDSLNRIIADTTMHKIRHNKSDSNIRAGFYVNWDPQSFYSLKANIDKINLVIPEWLFVQDNADTIMSDIDIKALKLMRQYGVKITPMISNYFNQKWNPDNVVRIITSKKRKQKFISSVIRVIQANQFQGINIDFESIDDKFSKNLNEFQKDLYTQLHNKGYIISQDVTPFSNSYELGELQKYNDQIILMAYDLHYMTSEPGPITDPDWITKILDSNLKIIPAGKIILGLAAYGYDWPLNSEAEDITYLEALEYAYENEETVTYDSKSNNLQFSYEDDNGIKHNVWFTDAAIAFNEIRIAENYGIGGVALWRLGGEDPRIWKFFELDMNEDSLNKNPFNPESLHIINSSNNLDFQNEGEILDIVSTPRVGIIDINYDKEQQEITGEKYEQLPSSYLIKRFGIPQGKQILLTFDDGPNEKYTPQILDILKKENIHATFFVVGINAENNLKLIKRTYDEGHEIGNHTFLHPNLAEVSKERVEFELNATRRLIESVTGHSTVLFRPPYNADSEPENMEEVLPIIEAKKYNYYTVGESIDPQDWEPNVSVDSIMSRIIAEQTLGNIILLHDAGGDRSQTVKALPKIIEYFRSRGYNFVTVSSLLGKNRDEVMPPLKNKDDILLSKLNWTIVSIIYWIERFVYRLFTIGIVLSIMRLLFVAVLAGIQKRKKIKSIVSVNKPSVSLIVPAFNEEVNAVKNILNLLKNEYPNFDIIFVDDGSSDNTYKYVKEAFDGKIKVKVLTKPNGGKSTALNLGIANSQAEIVICIDADTQLMGDAITKLVEHFNTREIAAIAGNVKVGNVHNLLTKWQSLEYITSQNFDKRAFDLLNCITVVPGAIGAFRKDIILEVGGFTTDTLAEDCDLTIRILRAGYEVRYAETALAYTEAPETIKMFLRQRFRWSFGIMQSLWKNRDALFNTKYRNLGFIALPNILFFQFLLPIFSPFAELMMILGFIGGYFQQILVYYILFLLVDVIAAGIAISFEKERLTSLWILLPQRFVYRQLMFWVLVKSIIMALKGTLVGWGILKRTGNVRIKTAKK
jgi:cellulose synthase/poly-beta-1,6-N-acetylglucosamine synthase-like glycosyltransferase/spore germination protein YaaH/peptidoglycan/xylan/chitin deacetylase (PgdA/CDA1 family)